MTKIYSVLLTFFLLIAGVSQAQQLKDPQPGKAKKSIQKNSINTPFTTVRPVTNQPREKCGFSWMMEQAKAAGFNEALYEQQMEALIQQRIATYGTGRPAVIYTVPVIFHVIYSGTNEATIGTGANV